MRRSKYLPVLSRLKRVFKVTLILTAFFSIPTICKNTIIALTTPERASDLKPDFEPLTTNFKPLTEAEAIYFPMIAEAGSKYGVDPQLIRAVINQESGFKIQARSHKNAQGLMQLIPATAQRFGIKNPYDPQQNIDGGAHYLSWLLNRFEGNVRLALAGYNAGEGAVKKYGNRVPPYQETRRYVKRIVAAYGRPYHAVPAQSQPADNTFATVAAQ